MLQECVLAVANTFGAEPRCVDSAALLQQAAAHLGYILRPRPVRLSALDTATGNQAYMGQAAEVIARHGNVEDLRPPGQEHSGHVVLTCEDPQLLLDPNLLQLAAAGINAPSVYMTIRSLQPPEGQWVFTSGPLIVSYYLDEGDRTLLADYDDVLAYWAKPAENLARLIRSGAKGNELVAHGIT